MIGASFAVQIWQLFLSQGVCFGIGMGFLFNGSVGIVPQWFSKRRSLANGIGTAGSGLGGLAYSLAAGALIPKVGLGWTFRILGIIAFVVNFICSIIIKDRNKIIGVSQLAFDYRLFKRPEFIMLQGWGVFTMLGYVVLLFSIPNYALSVGLTAEQGAVIGALLNLGQGLGRPFVGYFSDSAGRINIAGSLTFVSGVLCLVVWVFAKSYGVLIFFAILSGTVAGTFWTTVGPVSAEVVGLKELPSCLSITWLVLVIPTTFSEAIALELRRPSGDIYLDAQVYTGFAYIAAALCAWGVRAWKVGQLECLAAEQGRPGEEVDVSEARTIERTVTQESKKYRSSFVRRMFIWKRV